MLLLTFPNFFQQEAEGRVVAAVCAAPAYALLTHGIAKGKKVTSYPCFKDKMEEGNQYTYLEVIHFNSMLYICILLFL
jgi:putative intracellular protease/amidase